MNYPTASFPRRYMLRSLLVGLDGSAHSRAATDLGLRWASQSGATLVGLGVVDEPDICAPEPVPLGAGAFKEMLDESRLEQARNTIQQAVERFSQVCAEAGVPHQALEDVGEPAERIAREAQRHDVILMGQKTFFRLEGEPGHVLDRLLKNSPRPLVATPAEPRQGAGEGDCALVAFDGSLQAARALQMFVLLEVASLYSRVAVFSLDAKEETANRHVQRAADYLKFHGVEAQRIPLVSGDAPAKAILRQAEEVGAGLIVMGCYGQSTFKELFLGSATTRLLDTSPFPMFLCQ